MKRQTVRLSLLTLMVMILPRCGVSADPPSKEYCIVLPINDSVWLYSGRYNDNRSACAATKQQGIWHVLHGVNLLLAHRCRATPCHINGLLLLSGVDSEKNPRPVCNGDRDARFLERAVFILLIAGAIIIPLIYRKIKKNLYLLRIWWLKRELARFRVLKFYR